MHSSYIWGISVIGTPVIYYLCHNIKISHITNMMIGVFEHLIYYKSMADVKLALWKKKFIMFLTENDINMFNTKNNIEFIENGDVVLYAEKDDLTNLDISLSDACHINYDFLIYSVYDENTDRTNKKIITNSKPKLTESDFEIEESDVHFILTEILIGDRALKIYLKTSNYNYYLVNNTINKEVLIYFIKTYYPEEDVAILNDENLKLVFLDNNVNNVECKNSIVLRKTDYILNE